MPATQVLSLIYYTPNSMRTSVWLVRHGQTIANLQRRYQSWSDSPLTEYGQRQNRALAHRLRRLPFDVIILSPTERTRLMARTLTVARPDVPLVEASDWAETHHGDWEGLTYHEVRERFPQAAQQRFADAAHGKPPGGESLTEVATRVTAGWQALHQRYPGGRVLLVTHATPVQIMLCNTFGLPPTRHWNWRIDLGSVTCLDSYGGGTIVRMVNEVPELKG